MQYPCVTPVIGIHIERRLSPEIMRNCIGTDSTKEIGNRFGIPKDTKYGLNSCGAKTREEVAKIKA